MCAIAHTILVCPIVLISAIRHRLATRSHSTLFSHCPYNVSHWSFHLPFLCCCPAVGWCLFFWSTCFVATSRMLRSFCLFVSLDPTWRFTILATLTSSTDAKTTTTLIAQCCILTETIVFCSWLWQRVQVLWVHLWLWLNQELWRRYQPGLSAM